jgi:type I restriction enzyme M protein
MQNKSKISKFAEVISGYTFRGAIKEDRESSLHVLQAKNIRDEILITDEMLVRTTFDTSHTNAFAQDGDVAISTRGTFRAAVLRSSKKIIASSSVYLLRLKNGSPVLPEFLSIYLNSDFGQKDISQITTGAAIKLILRRDLEDITIPILPMTQQEKVVMLYQNIRQQENLFKRRNELHKNIMNATFHQLIRS